MNPIIIILSIFIILLVIYILYSKNLLGNSKEGFTADGWVLNIPPEWFIKPKYDMSQWLVTYYPDQLSKPECLPYNRGDPEELNYNASVYRFWRQ